MEVARAQDGEARLELRTADPLNGPLLAVVTVPSTANRYSWTTVTAPLTGAVEGVHDLYLVLHGGLRLAAFTVGREVGA